ncbi:MAG TPA: SDR family oxidoreductase [Solirubrobacterales bacterium]|nr:SDR family oxidoreductase [Solirubrobacterales bacterium]
MASGDKGAVLVTGASSGIGRATAMRLERDGYTVFAGVRKQADADSLEQAAAHGRIEPVILDVTEESSIEAARIEVEHAVGDAGLAGLVNNAGIANAGPVEHLPVEEFQRVLDVNLTGQYAVTQAFLPLIRRGDGAIVFITSMGGLVATPFMSPYHASKFGVEAVADSLRRELLPWGIRVVVVEPGSIATPIWEKGAENFASAEPKMGGESKRMYGRQLEAMKDTIRTTAERGIPPEKVAEVISRVIGSDNPKTRYLVGRDAKLAKRLSTLLGDKVLDRLMRRSMKLPDDAPAPR